MLNMYIYLIYTERGREISQTLTRKDCSDRITKTPNKLEVPCATWFDYKHHKACEFFVYLVPNLRKVLSKACKMQMLCGNLYYTKFR